MRGVLTSTTTLALLCVLNGCSSVNVWPFGSDESSARGSGPADATQYQCDGGKQFYVRFLNKGETAWLIYPDREVGLDKAASGGGTRYSNGTAVFSISGDEATLTDGPDISYTGCKAAALPK